MQNRLSSFLFSLAAIFSIVPENIYALNVSCDSHVSLKVNLEEIPLDRRQVIRETIAQVETIAQPHLKMPAQIRFEVIPEDRHLGFARPASGVIELPPMAMRISLGGLRSLVAHEVTHLILFQNFRALYDVNNLSLFEVVKKFGEQSDFTFRSVTPHWPFAEILCDVMAVLVARDPQAISRLIAEMIEIAPATLKGRLQKEFAMALGQRDFSISSWDPRWKEFDTSDVVYARYNQVRSYLWESHMRNLETNLRADFFGRLFGASEQLYKGSDILERAYAGNDLFEVNQQIIGFLEGQLLAPNASLK